MPRRNINRYRRFRNKHFKFKRVKSKKLSFFLKRSKYKKRFRGLLRKNFRFQVLNFLSFYYSLHSSLFLLNSSLFNRVHFKLPFYNSFFCFFFLKKRRFFFFYRRAYKQRARRKLLRRYYNTVRRWETLNSIFLKFFRGINLFSFQKQLPTRVFFSSVKLWQKNRYLTRFIFKYSLNSKSRFRKTRFKPIVRRVRSLLKKSRGRFFSVSVISKKKRRRIFLKYFFRWSYSNIQNVFFSSNFLNKPVKPWFFLKKYKKLSFLRQHHYYWWTFGKFRRTLYERDKKKLNRVTSLSFYNFVSGWNGSLFLKASLFFFKRRFLRRLFLSPVSDSFFRSSGFSNSRWSIRRFIFRKKNRVFFELFKKKSSRQGFFLRKNIQKNFNRFKFVFRRFYNPRFFFSKPNVLYFNSKLTRSSLKFLFGKRLRRKRNFFNLISKKGRLFVLKQTTFFDNFNFSLKKKNHFKKVVSIFLALREGFKKNKNLMRKRIGFFFFLKKLQRLLKLTWFLNFYFGAAAFKSLWNPLYLWISSILIVSWRQFLWQHRWKTKYLRRYVLKGYSLNLVNFFSRKWKTLNVFRPVDRLPVFYSLKPFPFYFFKFFLFTFNSNLFFGLKNKFSFFHLLLFFRFYFLFKLKYTSLALFTFKPFFLNRFHRIFLPFNLFLLKFIRSFNLKVTLLRELKLKKNSDKKPWEKMKQRQPYSKKVRKYLKVKKLLRIKKYFYKKFVKRYFLINFVKAYVVPRFFFYFQGWRPYSFSNFTSLFEHFWEPFTYSHKLYRLLNLKVLRFRDNVKRNNKKLFKKKKNWVRFVTAPYSFFFLKRVFGDLKHFFKVISDSSIASKPMRVLKKAFITFLFRCSSVRFFFPKILYFFRNFQKFFIFYNVFLAFFSKIYVFITSTKRCVTVPKLFFFYSSLFRVVTRFFKNTVKRRVRWALRRHILPLVKKKRLLNRFFFKMRFRSKKRFQMKTLGFSRNIIQMSPAMQPSVHFDLGSFWHNYSIFSAYLRFKFKGLNFFNKKKHRKRKKKNINLKLYGHRKKLLFLKVSNLKKKVSFLDQPKHFRDPVWISKVQKRKNKFLLYSAYKNKRWSIQLNNKFSKKFLHRSKRKKRPNRTQKYKFMCHLKKIQYGFMGKRTKRRVFKMRKKALMSLKHFVGSLAQKFKSFILHHNWSYSALFSQLYFNVCFFIFRVGYMATVAHAIMAIKHLWFCINFNLVGQANSAVSEGDVVTLSSNYEVFCRFTWYKFFFLNHFFKSSINFSDVFTSVKPFFVFSFIKARKHNIITQKHEWLTTVVTKNLKLLQQV